MPAWAGVVQGARRGSLASTVPADDEDVVVAACNLSHAAPQVRCNGRRADERFDCGAVRTSLRALFAEASRFDRDAEKPGFPGGHGRRDGPCRQPANAQSLDLRLDVVFPPGGAGVEDGAELRYAIPRIRPHGSAALQVEGVEEVLAHPHDALVLVDDRVAEPPSGHEDVEQGARGVCVKPLVSKRDDAQREQRMLDGQAVRFRQVPGRHHDEGDDEVVDADLDGPLREADEVSERGAIALLRVEPAPVHELAREGRRVRAGPLL